MSRLARNTLFLTLASVAQKAVAFLYFSVIAVTIGEDLLGPYVLALALTTSIGVLDDAGMTLVLIRDVAQDPASARDRLRAVWGWKAFTMPLTLVVGFFAPMALGFSEQATLLTHLAIIIMLLDTISVTLFGVLRGFHVLWYESLGVIVGQALTTTFGAIALFSGAIDLRWLIAALMLGSAWNAGFSAVQVARRCGWSALLPAFPPRVKVLRAGLMFFLSAVCVKVYSYFDSLTIRAILGEGAVGVYAVAYKLTYAFQFLPMAFVGALYPTLSALAGDLPKARATLQKALWYTALLSAPLAFGIAALAPEIIGFYGRGFTEAAAVLSVLIFVLPFIFLDFPFGALLNATGHQAKKTIIMAITMCINIAANLILVPRIGLVGAAWAAVASFSFLFFAGAWVARRTLGITFRDVAASTWRLFASGAVMGIVVVLLKSIIPWMLCIPVGAVVFFGCAIGLKTITMEHLRAARALVRKTPEYVEHAPLDA